MCNRILELVERVKIPGVRAVDEINKPLLVRSNKKKVKGATDDVARKPDLGFVSLPAPSYLFQPFLEHSSSDSV
jgi:hypothetical protein